ncbi:hypothetical protein [Mycolicibacterium palauense]|uniref:hypothetical protein n=1 Tax=Mycolicibacterium palauense TaxID=2034511 RepID=UPI000BFEE374|nr:hypothetical protein [Mycolicibacterium palauense]
MDANTAEHADFHAMFGAFPATLYHGTRRSLADAILRDGFRPPSPVDLVEQVADKYGMSLEAVWADMVRRQTFTLLDDRAGTVSATADLGSVGKWAGRAPESRWDALRSVYVLTHLDSGDYYARSDEADFWVMAQQLSDPPVAVEIRSPIAALRSWPGGRPAVDILRAMLESRPASADLAESLTSVVMSFRNTLRVLPEWRADAADVEAVAVQPVPTRVVEQLLGFMSGLSMNDVDAQVRAGVWGEPGNHGEPATKWFPFDQVWPRLTPERRYELEQLAGCPLG